MKKGLILVLLLSLIVFSFAYGCGPKKPETGKVSGRVVDENGEPVAGAKVSLDGMSDTTLDDGSFTFNEVEPGSYTLEVTKEEFKHYTKDIEVSQGASLNLNISLNKKTEKLEFKSPTELASYHIIIYTGPSKDKAKKVFELWKDEGGDKIRVVAYEEEEKTAELIKVGDDYAMKVGDAWSKNQPGLKEFFNGILKTFEEEIEVLKNSLRDIKNYSPELEDLLPFKYEIKKLGEKIVNGYKSTGYKIVVVKKEGNEPGINMELWAINSGEYRGYITKQDVVLLSPEGESAYYGYNFFDIGKKQNITMP